VLEAVRATLRPEGWQRRRAALAYAIAALSILVAIVGYRAAQYASEASRLDGRAVREEARGKQLLAQRDARIAHDKSLAADVHALRVEAKALSAASRRLADRGDVSDATDLRLRALRARAALELLVLRGFIVSQPILTRTRVGYDDRFARAVSTDTEEIDILDVDRFARRADEADETSLSLLKSSAVVVIAIALLAIARVLGRRLGDAVGVLGLACAVLGVGLFLWVGP
jgi:hypothetical protein